MPFKDEGRGVTVIRLVVDGPPYSGKTTTLRSLAAEFGRDVFSPAEDEGRTLYFDWMEYTGGLFDGGPIHCEVVTVPGQEVHARRRRAILAEADAVIFVADTSPGAIATSWSYLEELHGILANGHSPRPGVILQANKRDVEGAPSLEELRATLRGRGWNLGVVESVATAGEGVRTAFVFGVRLALDRVRALASSGALQARGRGEEGPRQLFNQLLREDGARHEERAGDAGGEVAEPGHGGGEGSAGPPPGPPGAGDRELGDRRAARELPLLPGSDLPGGFIWPPVEGRIFLQEAETASAPRLHLSAAGIWTATQESGWFYHSHRDHLFANVEEARGLLIRWSRLHAGARDALSRRRCLALAPGEERRWRLWQVVHREPTMDDFLRAPLPEPGARVLAQRLAEAVSTLAAVRQRLALCHLSVSPRPDEVMIIRNESGFLGLAPEPKAWEEAVDTPAEPASPDLLSAEPGISPQLLAELLSHHRLLPEDVRPHLEDLAGKAPELAALIAGMMGHRE